MTRQKQIIENSRFLIAALSLFCACLLIALFYTQEAASFDNEKVHLLTGSWVYTAPDGSVQNITLPAQLPAQAGREAVISRTLPEGLGRPVVLCIRSSQQSLRVILDGAEVYAFGNGANARPFGKSPGSAWNLVRLPEDCVGKTIQIALTSPYPAYSGIFEEIWVGSKAALLFHLMGTYALSFAVAALTLAMGAGILLFHFYFSRRGKIGNSSLDLGLLTLLVAIWLLGNNKLLQFFTGNQLFTGTLSAFGLMSFPIPLLAYAEHTENFRYHKLVGCLRTVLVVQMGAAALLQLLRILDFVELFTVYYFLTGVCIAAACVALMLDWRRNNNQAAKLVGGSLVMLLACGCLQLFANLFHRNVLNHGFLRMGLLVFVVVQARFALRRAGHIFDLSKEALTDALTGCRNRTAYLRRLADWNLQEGASAVMADLNQLKQINDTMGHEMGDDAIVRCATCFRQVFEPYGACFRIGGDEFLFLGSNMELAELERLNERFEQLCRQEKTDYSFCVASGAAVFDPDLDSTLEDTVRRADKRMYRRKEMQKQDALPQS